MKMYFLRRILAIIPTFFGITLIVFIILNMAPGGPVEQMIRQIRFSGLQGEGGSQGSSSKASNIARDSGVNQEIIEALKRQYGFDKPIVLNLRIADARTGGIDAIAKFALSLNTTQSNPLYTQLEHRGTLLLPLLIDALLNPHGSDYGINQMISDNGLMAVKKDISYLLEIPEIFVPLIKQPPRIQKAIESSSDLIRLYLDSSPEKRLAILRSIRILETQMNGTYSQIEWNWKNPISEPFLEFVASYSGYAATASKENLMDWWNQNQVVFDPSYVQRSISSFFSSEIGSRERLVLIGQAALYQIITFSKELPDESLPKFIEIVSLLSGVDFGVPQSGPELNSALDRIDKWWEENHLTYMKLTRWQKITFALTHTRYWLWLKNIITLDFGQSYTYDQPVIDVILSKMPVSIQFGVTTFFMTYLICIPLGIWKAIRDGSSFDYLTSIILFLLWSVPGFMLAVLLIVFFGGGSFFNLIPIGGLYSDNYFEMSLVEKIWDRIHHFLAPLICYMIAEFTTLTLLMKNSIIEEISKEYCRTARAKGLSERTVYLKHALRNALIPIATGIGGFLGIFFTGSMLLELIFNLDGMGLLGYASVLSRDFNVIMGDLVILSMITLLGNILSDFIYTVVDPRIDFGKGTN